MVEPTPLKNDGRIVSWDDMTFPTEWKVIKLPGSKPPTSHTNQQGFVSQPSDESDESAGIGSRCTVG